MEAVIFDLDGVIVHTDEYHFRAWKALADRIGVYFDREINNRLRGVSRMESLEIILERSSTAYSTAEKAALAEEKNALYRSFLQSMTPADVTPQVRQTLSRLKEKGYKLAIGSSSKNAKLILENVGLLNDVFDAISDGNNITNSKPHPEVFLKAAEYLGVEPQSCCVVEDAEAGLQAAKSAMMTAIAIGPATGSELADYRLSEFADLLDILK